MRDFLRKFPQICLCDGINSWQHDSVAVIGNSFLPEKMSVRNDFEFHCKVGKGHFVALQKQSGEPSQ